MITPDDVLDHYVGAFGGVTRAFSHRGRTVRDVPSEIVIDVLMFSPREATGGVTLFATVVRAPGPLPGHRNEFFMGLAPSTDGAAHALTDLAAYEAQTGEGLGPGHTVPFGAPLWEGTRMSAFLTLLPISLDLIDLGDHESHVEFLQAIPLFEVERLYKVANGIEALFDAWRRRTAPVWDPFRSLDKRLGR